MRIAVIYKSRTGNARRFAEMIAEELNADLFSSNKFHIERLFTYDTIIFGGGLYARGVYGLRNIINNLDVLGNKNLIVFATGATTPTKQQVDTVLKNNFSERLLSRFKVFYLHTGINHNKLSWVDKMYIRMMKRRLERKQSRTDEENSLLTAYTNTMYYDEEATVKPIIEYVKGL